MNAVVLLCCFAALWAAADGQRMDISVMDPEFYCKRRPEIEFFRKQLPEDISEEEARAKCRHFYRCVGAGGSNRKLVMKNSCGYAMFFDIELQTCQVRTKVHNCVVWEKFQKAKPKWPLEPGEVNNCPGGEIECGSGECLSRSFFCDDKKDCADGSDENICNDPRTDPNAADKCNPRKCLWDEGCFCSVDGSRIPGELEPHQTPQMILITFTGAINEESMLVYQKIFSSTVKNKGNDCTAKGTFFVSNAFTNYSAVQELARKGHEIGSASVTNNNDKEYWSNLSSDDYQSEFDDGRMTIERFSNLTQGDIIGMRVPQGRVGGNQQFKMMVDWGFLYDSSLAAPRGNVPIWPYTLQHRMPHKCLGTDQNCPTRNFTVWEMVMNELDRRDDPFFSELLTGCHYIDQCANLIDPKQFRNFLETNLQHHYQTNRAPLGLHFTSAYFLTRKDFLREFSKWIADVSQRGDFFFVNMLQAINWMEAPIEIAALNSYPEWKLKCDPKGLPYCSLPNPCATKPPRPLAHEGRMYLHTCEDCPRVYPWLYDPYGEGPGGFDL
uniref:Gastrolith protein n=1 Tax=Hirondellea gigas TaxID=1518452 RepID=A0A6A7FMW0_9CRUS